MRGNNGGLNEGRSEGICEGSGDGELEGSSSPPCMLLHGACLWPGKLGKKVLCLASALVATCLCSLLSYRMETNMPYITLLCRRQADWRLRCGGGRRRRCVFVSA